MVKYLKYFCVELDTIRKTENGFTFSVRTGEQPIKVGDYIGHCKIVKLQAYGKELDEFCPAITGQVTVEGKHLGLLLVESRPLCYNLDDLKKDREFLDSLIKEMEIHENQRIDS